MLALFLFTAVAPLHAHTSLPAYLELKELSAGSFEVVWRVPAAEGPPPAIYPVLPTNCLRPAGSDGPSEEPAPASVVLHGIVDCGTTGLAGQRLEIAGLPTTVMDVLVRITFADSRNITRILRPVEPSFTVPFATKASNGDAPGYLRLGVGHILGGIDHLLFVLGLLLIVSGSRRLLKAVTAFTVAHSITLALATFGIVKIAPTPVETVIALSIVFLAVELVRHQQGVDGLSYEKPWLVAFAFGLLHGFGFAGTLSQIGIPSGDIPMALFFFNVGVEAGQLGFIAVFLTFTASLQSLEIPFPRWTLRLPAYAIGSFASFWFLQRCMLILGF
jgi:hydrogenase/urease accessory protein HupE